MALERHHVTIAQNLRFMIATLPHEATDRDLISIWQDAGHMTDRELCAYIEWTIQNTESWADAMSLLCDPATLH
jgi:hypothetical protein